MPQYSNTTVYPLDQTKFGSIVNYTCHIGFRYNDRAPYKQRRCNADAQWEPDEINFPRCESKLDYTVIRLSILPNTSFKNSYPYIRYNA